MKVFTKRNVSVMASAMTLVAGMAAAQNGSTGKLSGTVTDPTGAGIPGAQVTLVNQGTDGKRDVVTSKQGIYEFPLLPPGTYRIEITVQGFKTAIRENIAVNVTESENLPITLTIGSTSESIEVSTEPELLQTDSAAMGQVVTAKQLTGLPLVTRNFTQILGLSAGVTISVTNAAEVGRGSQSSEANSASGGKYVHGARPEDNNFQINGIQVNDQFGGGLGTAVDLGGGLPIPNPDTLSEFKVQTAQFDSSFGRNSGGQINIITKGGTNKFHGSAWEFFRNEDLNANDYFRKLANQKRGLLRQNQYGGTLGGPVVHDKLYFFGSYQGTKQTNGIAPGCQATQFSPLLTNDRSAGAIGALFAGQSGVFGGPAVLASGANINPVALQILQTKNADGTYLLPTPQSTTSVNGTVQGISTFSSPCTYAENQFVSNLDYTQSSRSVFAAKFFWLNSTQNTTFSGSTTPGFGVTSPDKFRVGSLSHTFSFSPSLVNEAIVGINDTTAHSTDNANPTSWNSLGIPTPVQGSNGFGLSIAGSYLIDSPFQQRFDQFDVNFVDSLSYTRGRHSLRAGGGLTREHINIGSPILANEALFLSFPDFLIGLHSGPTATGGNGTPFSNEFGSIAFSTGGNHNYRAWEVYGFLQDDWKATSKLTMNLGLRYEHLGDFADANGRNSGFNPALADPSNTTGSLNGFFVNSNYMGGALPAGVAKLGAFADEGDKRNTFMPRFGFAYQMFSNAVLRGGYGVFYSVPNASQLFNTSNGQPWATTAINVGAPNAPQSEQSPFPNLPNPASLPIFTPYHFGTALTVQTLDYNFRPSINQVYSLNNQISFTNNLLLELGYVGARGEHLFQQQQRNAAGFATPQAPIRGVTTNSVANVTQRVPIQGFNPSGVSVYGSEGASWYNGMDVTLTQRTSHGLQFQVAYTWAKTMDTNAPNAGLQTLTGNPNNNFRRYGEAFYDRRHRVAINYVYDFPVTSSKALAETVFVNGWQLAGVTTFQTGNPLNLTVTNANNYSGYTADFANVSCPASKLLTQGSKATRRSQYFNLSCITSYPVVDPSGATGFGNAPVSSVFGPGQDNFDVALVKHTPVRFPSENANVELRIEAFNLFNHTQFSNPGTAGSAAPAATATTAQAAAALGTAFGAITSTSVSARVMQFALKYNF